MSDLPAIPDARPHPAARYLLWAVLLGVGGVCGSVLTLVGLTASRSLTDRPRDGLLLAAFQPEPLLQRVRAAHALPPDALKVTDDQRLELFGAGSQRDRSRIWAERRTVRLSGKVPAATGAAACQLITRELQDELGRHGLSQTRSGGSSGHSGDDFETAYEFHYTHPSGRTGYGLFTGTARGGDLRATLLLFEDR
ncbi:MAG: hypothetical protein U0871_22220 [Gemmataceae bacterium]